MKKFSVVALDMDETLLNEAGEVSPDNKEWIQKLDNIGIPIILATGRGYQRVENIQKGLGINHPMVLVNGAETWKKRGDLLNRTLIPKKNILALQKIALQYDATYWGYTSELLVKYKDFRDEMLTLDWVKFGIKHPDILVVNRIRKDILQSMNVECTSSNPHNIECAAFGLSKKTGLREVCDFLDISMREVVAIGDNQNDIEMIKAAGLGVAMDNAPVNVKKMADMVTYTNEKDGVSHVIKKIFF